MRTRHDSTVMCKMQCKTDVVLPRSFIQDKSAAGQLIMHVPSLAEYVVGTPVESIHQSHAA